MIRRQLPVRSPLPFAALWSGARAMMGASRARAARDAVLRGLHARFGDAQVLLTDSGTTALSLAIGIATDDPARPVALPAYGCYDLATAVDGAQVPFVLYDVDPATLGPDRGSLERALRAGADRIVIAHFHGIPVDITMVRGLAAAHGARIIDDAAQGAGASIDGVPVGALGDFGVLSFGRGKGITGGGGGALLIRTAGSGSHRLSEDVAPQRGALGLAKTVAQWILARPSVYRVPASLPFLGLGETVYHPPHTPSGMTRAAMGVLQGTLPLAERESATRRANAERLLRAVAGGTLRAPTAPRGALPGYLRLALLADERRANAVRRGAVRDLGVMPGYPVALADLDRFGARRLNAEEPCDGARELAARLVTLPTHGALTERDLRALEAWCAG